MSDYLAVYSDVIGSDDQDFTFGRYTASLDASVALVGRVLSGWAWMVGCAPGGGYFCTLQEALDDEVALGGESDGFGWSPALAVCTALLRALIARQVQPEAQK